jgi:GST-like protein
MIELYFIGTGNGYKASVALEEVGLPYIVHKVDMATKAHKAPDYLKINPVGRVPAIVDNDTPSGRPVAVFETNAIALYLGEKTGKFIPADLAERAQMHGWMSVAASGLGAAASGIFFMGRSPEPIPFAVDFYRNMALMTMQYIDTVLATRPYLAGNEYSLADIVMYPGVVAGIARQIPDALDGLNHLKAWTEKVGARPAVQRGLAVS